MQRCAPIDVLLVEDNPADVYVTQRVIADAGEDIRVWVVPDGEEALLFLRKDAPVAHAPTPVLILLDLILPHMDGALLIPQIRQLPGYEEIPIVVLSSAPQDREEP